ncbi:hypothetical protein XCR_4366 [Xanthomonas campestris pv. raphani 756C]|nr:hypothetical protein XCR_4366 [Xanthomonas campestris pv. raphani 756C]
MRHRLHGPQHGPACGGIQIRHSRGQHECLLPLRPIQGCG